jgi:hypothetical protein
MADAIVSVDHSIERPLVILDSSVLARVSDLVSIAETFDVIGEANFSEADGALKTIAKLLKDIEKDRKTVKAPVLDLEKAIDKAAKAATAPLSKAKQDLSGRVAAYVRAVQEERRRVAAENQRKIDEENRKAEERRRQEEAERRKREEADKRTLAERIVAGSGPSEPKPEPPRPQPVQLEKPPEEVKSSVSIRKKPKPHVFDRRLIPWEIAGETLLEVDMAAVKRLRKKGIDVPGIAWIEEEELATRST